MSSLHAVDASAESMFVLWVSIGAENIYGTTAVLDSLGNLC
jgi:hypothetical protein